VKSSTSSDVGNVKTKATLGNASGSNAKEKPMPGSTTKKKKELGEVAANAESGLGGKGKAKATSRNASKKLKGKTLETAVATLGEGTASVEKAQGGKISSSNLSYEQQASVLVELLQLGGSYFITCS
jgi:hypothetical protein